MRACPIVRRATRADLDTVLSLVREARLSEPGIAEHLDDFFVAEREGIVVGAIGLEMRGADALLRSAVVTPDERSTGVGAALTEQVLAHATAAGVRTLWLLTTSADGYWARYGFVNVDRAVVPEPVRRSEQFRGACPASAVAMRRSLP